MFFKILHGEYKYFKIRDLLVSAWAGSRDVSLSKLLIDKSSSNLGGSNPF
eukprot:SAG31_NODE_3091_length_4683_cov_47.153578_2_plen_50_part_00